MDERILGRIAAALRTAENAGTDAEADNAMQVAQRLATTYSIDLAVARAHSAGVARPATPTHRSVVLGERGKRGLRTYVALFLAIARANEVTCNIAHDSTYVIAFGFADDVDVCEALYASLVVQMVRSGDAYLRTGRYRHERVYRKVTRTEGQWRHENWTYAPPTPVSARIAFHQAFAQRVEQRLGEARAQAKQAAIAADRDLMARTDVPSGAASDTRTGTELAIIAKEVEVADYYRANSTARGAWRGGHVDAAAPRGALAAGDRAGRAARLGTERAIGGKRRGLAS